MAILERVIRMKQQGASDGEIINELSQSGVTPREISEALKQAQIKYAISDSQDENQMQPSIMSDGVPSPDNSDEQVYLPRAYQPEEQQYPPQAGYQTQEYQPQEQYPSQEQYYQPGAYEQYASAGIDTNTIMEVADQVFSDKIRKIQKQVDNITEISTLLQTKMENVSERLKRMETIIDKLQIAILEKVGSYGRNMEGIKKEMSMMQDSFSKMISPRRTERKEESDEIEDLKRKISKKK